MSNFCVYCGEKTELATQDNMDKEAKPSADKSRPIDCLYCAYCSAVLPNKCESCLVCSTKKGHARPDHRHITVPFSLLLNKVQPKVDSVKRTDIKRMALFIAGFGTLLAVISIAFLFPALYASAFPEKNKEHQPIIYLQDEHTLKFKTQQMSVPKTIATDFFAGDSGHPSALTSPNGKYIAYLNFREQKTAGELYILPMQINKGLQKVVGESILISGQPVVCFYFDDNDSNLVYLTHSGELFATDYNRTWRLDSDVSAVLTVKHGQIIYSKSVKSMDGLMNVYVSNINSDTPSIFEVGREISQLVDYNDSFTKFLLTVKSPSSFNGIESFDLVHVDTQSSEQAVLVTGIAKVLDGVAEDATAVYLVAKPLTMRYSDIILDDFAKEDLELLKPNIEDFAMVSQYYSSHGEVLDFSSAELSEDVIEQAQQYQLRLKLYEEKLMRDYLRDSISAQLKTAKSIVTYELHLLSAGKTTKLEEHIRSDSNDPQTMAEGDLSHGFAVYNRVYWGEEQKVKISTLFEKAMQSITFSVQDLIEQNMKNQLVIGYINGTKERLYLSDTQEMLPFTLLEKPNGVAFISNKSDPVKNRLHYTEIIPNQPVNVVEIGGGVEQIYDYSVNTGFVYKKNDNSLMQYKDKSATAVGFDVASVGSYNDGKTLMFLENADNANAQGDLVMLTGNKRILSGGVQSYYYRSDNSVLVLKKPKEQSAQNCELYMYNGRELVLLDSDVSTVLEY